MPALLGATLQDMFADRETVTNASGQINGDNTTATVEVGEPQHANKPGGHSVWLSWVAPSDGIATFETDGSSFDTLLAAYFFGSTNDTTLDKLHVAAANDDYPGIAPASEIQFGALAGHHYEIAVDGYYGATGSLRLTWSFLSATSPPPIVLSIPPDQSARQGDPVTLTVNMITTPSVQLQWRHDEVELEDLGTNLFIPSLQPTNVGRYSLRVTLGSVRFFTAPTEIQINSEGSTNTLARDKLFDALGSALDGSGKTPSPPGSARFATKDLGVVRGYNGSQIFDTTAATIDPTEPAHCSVVGGASYWLAYQPPTNGTITLDTIGSTFDTVLQTYTYNGVLTGYADLISIACDNDSVAPHGAARVTVPVIAARKYLIVVDGVAGARGIAYLNYSLNTNALPTPPLLLSPITSRVALPGTSVTLAPSVAGCPPLRFSWKKNQTVLSNAVSPSLFLPNVTFADSANYVVTVVNDLGTLNATQPFHVVLPPFCSLVRTPSGARLSWPTMAGQLYTIERASSLAGPWNQWTNTFLGSGQVTNFDLAGVGTEFYRVRSD